MPSRSNAMVLFIWHRWDEVMGSTNRYVKGIDEFLNVVDVERGYRV